MVLTAEEVTSLLNNPDKAAEMANLRYVSEDQLCIERKRTSKSFKFLKNGEPLSDKEEVERIKKLVIPPAWENVKICPFPNGHLQVTGLDARSRKQYIYHPGWTEIRNQTKFYKMAAFGKMLPKIRKQVDEDLDLKGMPQRKVIALVIRLMEETHIRIGNDCYAKQNKSYGLSTLRSRHVKISKGKMKFSFIGKKGKEHSISVRNKKLIRLVNRCEELPGWEVFKYIDENGEKKTIDSGMVNRYIQEITGELFSAKDFRTWGGTKVFFEKLMDMEYSHQEKDIKANIITAFDTAAEALGNTRSVCRSSYVHPKVVDLYESGEILPYFQKVARKRTSKPNLSKSEEVLLELLQDFEIEIKGSETR